MPHNDTARKILRRLTFELKTLDELECILEDLPKVPEDDLRTAIAGTARHLAVTFGLNLDIADGYLAFMGSGPCRGVPDTAERGAFLDGAF